MGLFRRGGRAGILPREFERFLVVDVETTGVNNSDRVVEVAAVTLSREGQILDEWDTLVNPERDVGPTYIHGVTASMVSAAPREPAPWSRVNTEAVAGSRTSGQAPWGPSVGPWFVRTLIC